MHTTNDIVVASTNAGKIKEFQEMLTPLGYNVHGQKEYSVIPAQETGLTFVENALLKARNLCEQTGLATLADDSGLEVDALKGEPGIYSARYAGENATDADNNAKLLEALKSVPLEERTARFHCVLVYMRWTQDPTPIVCAGAWEGRIINKPIGDNGFGYDPLFFIPELNATSAELSPERKNTLSHRGLALQQLLTRMPTPPKT